MRVSRAALHPPLLLGYCTRPPFALECLEQLAHDQVIYPDGRTELRLTPLEPIERLAALIYQRIWR